jgi:hypothetical protein
MELEKFIRARSESLAGKIDYNRSRLRICRAWVFHFLLIGIGFSWWNYRVQAVEFATYIWLIAGDILVLFFTWRTTYLLARDHQKDIVESFEIVVAMPQEK